MGDADDRTLDRPFPVKGRTELGPGSTLAPVPPEVYAALDLLERHCTERVVARYPRAVDFVLTLRQMVTATGASAPFASGIGPGDPGIDPADDAESGIFAP